MLEQTEIRNKLREYICQQLINNPSYPLGDAQSLVLSGLLDSFSITDIAVFIEEEFGIYIPNEEIDVDRFDTLDQIVNEVIKRQR